MSNRLSERMTIKAWASVTEVAAQPETPTSSPFYLCCKQRYRDRNISLEPFNPSSITWWDVSKYQIHFPTIRMNHYTVIYQIQLCNYEATFRVLHVCCKLRPSVGAFPLSVQDSLSLQSYSHTPCSAIETSLPLSCFSVSKIKVTWSERTFVFQRKNI